jgi:hypothetical protein
MRGSPRRGRVQSTCGKHRSGGASTLKVSINHCLFDDNFMKAVGRAVD